MMYIVCLEFVTKFITYCVICLCEYAIISLVLVIIGSCIFLFLLKVEFLSYIFLLIYIGAILILFLFIVMMLQLNTNELQKNKSFIFSKYNLIYIILCIKSILFLYFLNKNINIALNLISYEYLESNDIINLYYNLALLTGNDIILFLSIFTQKFYVI
jgi:NADH:ubiquinone oxidoreductase subunit 6 (subunit J)